MLMKSRWNLALDTGPVHTRPQARGNPRTSRPRAAPMGQRSPAAGCGITLAGPVPAQPVGRREPPWRARRRIGQARRAQVRQCLGRPDRSTATALGIPGARARARCERWAAALGGHWGSILRGAACPTGSPRPAGAVRCLNGGPDARPEASLATKGSTIGPAPHRLPRRGEAPAALAPSARGVGFAVGSRQNPPIPAWN